MRIDVFYTGLISAFRKIIKNNNLSGETVVITGKVLTAQEALGNPDRKDFPIQKGKERLMEAEFRGRRGQAYTDNPGNFTGTLDLIIGKMPEDNFERAVFISALNAVCAYLDIAGKTVHCRNNEPEICAGELAGFIKSEHGDVKIALVGYQPAMLEKLTSGFTVRNLDMDREKIGTMQYGVKIEDGEKSREEVLDWCDLILVTGSTVVNGSIVNFLGPKPVYFYGTTISGTAALMGLDRLCPCGGG